MKQSPFYRPRGGGRWSCVWPVMLLMLATLILIPMVSIAESSVQADDDAAESEENASPESSAQLIYFYTFAVLFGIGFGGRTPLTTAIRGDYFGRASFGKILGISTVPMNILLLIAAPMAGFMRDELGNYDMAFQLLAGLNLLGSFLFLIARKPKMSLSIPAEAAAEHS